MSILWTIIIGFVAGVIAKLLHPGPNEPSGFVLTTILGIVGALVATYLGQARERCKGLTTKVARAFLRGSGLEKCWWPVSGAASG
jgi:uncharacterized membrane protein YeaQ/YmgE (transglycosylase-associated protein family)